MEEEEVVAGVLSDWERRERGRRHCENGSEALAFPGIRNGWRASVSHGIPAFVRLATVAAARLR